MDASQPAIAPLILTELFSKSDPPEAAELVNALALPRGLIGLDKAEGHLLG